MMALLEEPGFLETIFRDYSYAAPFVVLLLCGVGLPLPEEVTLIGSGLLLYQGKVDFFYISVVCSAAILLGDSIPFVLGRRYGLSALRIPWVARLVHPERFEWLQRRFQTHGNWATFLCRFLAGIRIPGFFVAGMMEMRYARFLLLDGLGVLVSVPLSIYAGKLFGDQVEKLERTVGNLHLILAFLVLSLVLILVLRARRKPRAGDKSAAATAGNRGDEDPLAPVVRMKASTASRSLPKPPADPERRANP